MLAVFWHVVWRRVGRILHLQRIHMVLLGAEMMCFLACADAFACIPATRKIGYHHPPAAGNALAALRFTEVFAGFFMRFDLQRVH